MLYYTILFAYDNRLTTTLLFFLFSIFVFVFRL